MDTKINEIFESIQGEGPVVGYKQIFVRFCGCNLNCDYCDTQFQSGKIYTPDELYDYLMSNYDLSTFHSLSLTGGEPLLSHKFLLEFLPLIKDKIKIYLETNATLKNEFIAIKNMIDIVSADIKLPSSSGKDTFDLHDRFLSDCRGISAFAKIVFDARITDEEVKTCSMLGKKHDIELILQPKMIGSNMSVSPEFCIDLLDKFTGIYPKVRLIPQVHKFIDVR